MTPIDLFKRSHATIRANLALAARRRRRRRAAPVMPALHYLEFLVVAVAVVGFCALLLDAPVAAGRAHYPAWLTDTAQMLTRLGKSDWILIPSGVILILLTFRRIEGLSPAARLRIFRWNLWLSYIFVGVGLPSLISTLVKRVIGRARPLHFDALGPYDFSPFHTDASFASFPSGHATTVGALAMVLSIVAPKYRTFFLAAALVIGGTRIAIGAHYPSDVAGGLLFGAAVAYFVARLAAAHGLMFLDKASPWPELRPAFRLSRRAQ
jgi:Membrane-associated phospholipid phosphatase